MSKQTPRLTAEDYNALLPLVTAERLGSYLRASGGGISDAFDLYEWNMRAAAGVLELTSMVEVITRNALNAQLRTWSHARRGTASWLDVIPLDQRGREDIRRARARATHDGRRQEVHGRVVAELSLGFWRYLVESRYLTSLWIPATHAAFPGGHADLRTRQREVAFRMQQLNFVRNRAAHHEPLHQRDLAKDLRLGLDLANWASSTAGRWVGLTASLPQTLSDKPPPD